MSENKMIPNAPCVVAVPISSIVYVEITDRAIFDRIGGEERDHGDLLVKRVGDLGVDTLSVIFQHWIAR